MEIFGETIEREPPTSPSGGVRVRFIGGAVTAPPEKPARGWSMEDRTELNGRLGF